MASGDSLCEFPMSANESALQAWTILAFTSGGTHEVLVGDTLTGATSGSTAVVVLIEVTSGSWAGGDAAGFFVLKSQSAAFQAENLDEGANGNVCTVGGNSSPASATPNSRNGHATWDLDDTAVELLVFSATLPQHYAGGGITVYVPALGASATSGNLVISAAIERIGEVLDIDTDSFAALQDSAATAVNGTSGIPAIATVAFTNGAQMDSLAVGESFRLLVCRRSDLAGDTVVGDLQVIDSIEIRET